MERITIEHMITVYLGYCCIWAFFKRNSQTDMIATRLGVSDRAVRYRKAEFNSGFYSCKDCENCLHKKGVV